MPLQAPPIDARRFQDLYEEMLARVPVHTREWTNLSPSDPGVTLLQLFAFITESLLYRVNQIPDRNRLKFLQLLGAPLQPGAPASGLVQFRNERGPLETITLNRDLEVRAGSAPFRTVSAIDVAPVEARAYFKRRLAQPPPERLELYEQLYASFVGEQAPEGLELYELTPLEAGGVGGAGGAGVDIAAEAVDRALWIALIARPGDPLPGAPDPLAEARRSIANKTLRVGLVPQIEAAPAERRLRPGISPSATGPDLIQIQMPSIPPDRRLPASREPAYRTIKSVPSPTEPSVFEVPLPGVDQLVLWDNVEPIESGADNLPPALEDTAQNERLITWLRLEWPEGLRARVAWAGINVTRVTQRLRVSNEVLPPANGEPDQAYQLSKRPVIPSSIELTVTPSGAAAAPEERWDLIDDLFAAGPEIPAEDPRLPPGTRPPPARPSRVYALDAEAGRIRFGDGMRGARPPINAAVRVSYDVSLGVEGNVAAGAIDSSPVLPAGLAVSNPVRTWGGADPEPVAEGEKQVPRVLGHRERLVSAADFHAITLRAPGVEVGRVEVLTAYNPLLARAEPGNAPGAVTLMLIPKFSAVRPDAPSPDSIFLQAVCAHLEPRRLVTTELFLRGPDYIPIWISVGIEVIAGFDTPAVRDAVASRLREFLAPLRNASSAGLDTLALLASTPLRADASQGWPLRTPVQVKELEAEVARVPGVALVNDLLLGDAAGDLPERLPLAGLQLPRLDGISVVTGAPVPLSQIRGDAIATDGAAGPTRTLPRRRVPVPVAPREC